MEKRASPIDDQAVSEAPARVERPVWDRTTRIFHWLNFACVLALILLGTAILNANAFGVSAEGKILLKTLHVYVGYVFALNLTWRLVWAFIGSKFSRWSAFLPFRKGYGQELRAFLRGEPGANARDYLGHNPAGKLMILLLLLLLVIQASTGLMLAGTDLYKPPFGGAMAQWVTGGDPNLLEQLQPGSQDHVVPQAWEDMRAFRKPFVTIHEIAFYILLAAVLIHVLGVVVGEIRERNGLVSAMITGSKFMKEPAAHETENPQESDLK